MTGIAQLLRPRSVAVIGASADPTKTSGRPVAYLKKHGFLGSIYPVNPRLDRIEGLTCYPNIGALPATPDVGIVLLGAERAHQAVRELASRGAAAAIVLASGYTEVGTEGARRQRELVEAAGSMRLLGPNTIGLINLTDNITLSASGALEIDELPIGHVAVVSQSGGILGALLSRAAGRGIGLSKLVSTSNEADLEVADFIDYLVDDPETWVISLYLESVRYPEKFRRAALKAARAGKPVVAFKIGRSEAGARSTVSHTGALAGADRAYDALFDQVGVVRAHTFAELLDIPAGLASTRKLSGKRIAILTSTGGGGALVAESLGLAGFDTPSPDTTTAAALCALKRGSHAPLDSNPIDVSLSGLQPDLLSGALKILLASSAYDALVVVVGSSAVGKPDLMADAVRDSLLTSDKPVLAFISAEVPSAMRILNRRGVATFNSPESCAAALAAMLRVSQWTENVRPHVGDHYEMSQSDLQSGSLDEVQAKRLFARFGVPTVAEIVVSSPSEALSAVHALGPQVVVKILSSSILHKSDVGGVAVGVTAGDIGSRLSTMIAEVERTTGTAPQRFVVQKMVAGAVAEIILGLQRDTLGVVVLVGAGGIAAELFDDTSMRLLATGEYLARDEALAMLQELKTWPLLSGYRGRAKSDVDAIVSAIVSFSRMGASLGSRLIESEANPILVFPEGRGVVAVDGVAIIAAPDTGFFLDAESLRNKHLAYPGIVSRTSASLLLSKG